MAASVLGSVSWTAVTAITAVLTLVVAVVSVLAPLLMKRSARVRKPIRDREKSAEHYLMQLKAAAKAIDDVAAGRLDMSIAQGALHQLSGPEEEIRTAYGDESAVHWITRLNRKMLRRAFDIANGSSSPSDVTLHELIELGIDRPGVQVFEAEQRVAMQERDPVRTFVTPAMHIRNMAWLARLEPSDEARLGRLLVDD